VGLDDPNEFVRSDGTPGVVRSVEIGDHTGVVRASLWDEKVKTPLNEGDVIKIENPRVVLRNDHIELSLSRNTPIAKQMKKKLLKYLPSTKSRKKDILKRKSMK